MSRLVTVVGATGIQGGSVVSALLKDPSYSVRGITRNAQSDAAKALAAKGVSVVEADLDDADSLRAAFDGSYAIYAVTNFYAGLQPLGPYSIQECMDNETRQGINMANAAAATESLQHYVWSSLPDSKRVSGGRAEVPYYTSKNKVDEHIKTLPALLAKTLPSAYTNGPWDARK
jgi:uncharacterized protein YbjT (DUF2867 family)